MPPNGTSKSTTQSQSHMCVDIDILRERERQADITGKKKERSNKKWMADNNSKNCPCAAPGRTKSVLNSESTHTGKKAKKLEYKRHAECRQSSRKAKMGEREKETENCWLTITGLLVSYFFVELLPKHGIRQLSNNHTNCLNTFIPLSPFLQCR